jgi:hypothetical protein
MRDTMKIAKKISFMLFALVVPAVAQNRMVAEPSPAAAGLAYDMSVGYTNLNMAVPSARHVNLGGIVVGGSADLTPRWGAMADTTYVRTPDMLGTGHAGFQLSVLGGPEFHAFEHANNRLSLHGLAGAALADGAIPISGIDYFHGWLIRSAYGAGAGMDHALSGSFGVRLQADYVHSEFFDTTGAVRPQGSLRLAVKLVFHPKGGQRSEWR